MSEELKTEELKTPEMTPAEVLELEKLRTDRAASEARTAELQAQNRSLKIKDTLAKEIDAVGVRFHPSAEDIYKLLKAEPGFKVVEGADGDCFHVEIDGQPSSMTEALKRFALNHQTLADGRTLRGLKTDAQQVRSLEDLPTREDRQQYIAKHGADTIAALPAHPVTKHADPAKTMTCEEYLSLRIGDRAKIAGEVGEAGVSKILKRKEQK